jgi:putative transcriptional regulator
VNNRLPVWRARTEVTRAGLAEAVGVSRQTINAVERGRSDPSPELVFALADFFDCAVEEPFDPGDG